MSRVEAFETAGRRQARNDPATHEDDAPDEKLEHIYPFKMTMKNRNMLERVAKKHKRSMQFILTEVVWPAVEDLDRG